MIAARARRCSVHLDLIRGLAALAVFVGHARGVFLVDFREVSNPSLVVRAAYCATGLGHQAVMIFLVLSGYFITSSVVRAWPHWSWRDYLTDRLVRLYLVLVPGLVLTAIWDWVGRQWSCPALYEDRHPGTVFQFSAVQRSDFATFLANLVFLQHDEREGLPRWYTIPAKTLAGGSYTLYVLHLPALAVVYSVFLQTGQWVPNAPHLVALALVVGAVFAYAYMLAQVTEANTGRVRRTLRAIWRPRAP